MIVADNFDHPTSTTLTCYAATDTDTTWRKIVTTPLQPWMTKITHFGMFINDWGAPTNPATILLFADYGGNIIGDKIYGTMPPLLIPS
jgi:hypothetical protein